MLHALICEIDGRLLRLAGVCSDAEAEALVLRHGLAVLRRLMKGPRLGLRGKLFLAATSPGMVAS